jgi:hypothetical protein
MKVGILALLCYTRTKARLGLERRSHSGMDTPVFERSGTVGEPL